jgi:hypothetical protein
MQQTRIQENGSSTTIEVCKENEKKWPEYSMIGQKDWLKKDIGLEYLTKAVAIDRDYIKRLYNDDNKSKHDKNNPFKNVEEDLRFKV